MAVLRLHHRDGTLAALAIVDDEDLAWLSRWRWYLTANGYVARDVRTGVRKERFALHRVLLGLEPDDPRMGEHINRNRLDHRRANLRIAERGMRDNGQNRSLNINNTSGYRGVVLDRSRGQWIARVMLDGRRRTLGRFPTPEEAHQVVSGFRAQHMPFSEDARA